MKTTGSSTTTTTTSATTTRAWRYVSPSGQSRGRLEALSTASPSNVGEADAVVRLSSICLDDRADRPPTIAGVGDVIATGIHAAHVEGQRVVVPASILESNESSDLIATTRASRDLYAQDVVVPARWLCPLVDELALPGASAALLAREVPEAYALIIFANVAPAAPVLITETGVRGHLAALLCLARNAHPIIASDQAHPPRWVDELSLPYIAGVTTEALSKAADLHGSSRSRHLISHRLDVAIASSASSAWQCAALVSPDDDCGELPERVRTVVGAHPDLIPELAAMVVSGVLNLDGVATVAAATELGEDDGYRGRGLIVDLS